MVTAEMRGKWLDIVSSSEILHDDVSTDSRPSTSGRPRWFSVMQGIRRSLDVHLKSYHKIDNAFTSTLRHTSASDKLKALTKALADTGLVDFSCIYLVHPARGTFGVIALSGAGAELYPPRLGDEEAQRAIRQCDTGSQAFLNVFTRCVFQVKDSNWCVEDVVASRAPWYYDCASAVNGFGLPQDGCWLRRAGMRSVLALPCMQGDDVTGVLAVASKQKSLDHLLLRKLEELCFRVTPIVTDAVVEYSALLSNRRVASRYESISDFAHEVLGELLNLDRAVAASIGTGFNRTSANVSQHSAKHQHQQASAGTGCGRGRKQDERSAFDATAAVAAAAAAGFTWTAPAAVVAQHERQSAHRTDTYCTALTQDTTYTVVLTSDLPSVELHGDAPSTIICAASDRLSPLPVMPVDCEVAAALAAAGTASGPAPATGGDNGCTTAPQHAQQPLTDWAPTTHMAVSRSVPERQAAAAAAEDAAMDNLRRSDASQHQQQHKAGGDASSSDPATSASERNASRSTRSLSCLEFSGGMADVREELRSGCSVVHPAGSKCSTSAEVTSVSVAADERAGFAADCDAATAPRCLRAPPCTSSIRAAPRSGSPADLNHTTDSDAGPPAYMIESRSTEELAAALRNGSVTTTASPSPWGSSKNMESRMIMRGVPLEASVGAPGCAASWLAAPSVPSNAPTMASASADSRVPSQAFVTARGSSCATDYSMPERETATTLGCAHTSVQDDGAVCGGSSSAAQLSGAWESNGGGYAAGELVGEVRTSLRGLSRGRWSRDSAAAAAAVWSNEASEAFEAAVRFTAAQEGRGQSLRCGAADGQTGAESLWAARAGPASVTSTSAAPAGAAASGHFRGSCGGFSAAVAHGGLYGIRESGPVPSLQASLEFSDTDDGSVAVLDVAADGCGGFVLSSGLGVEALRQHQRQQQQLRGSGSGYCQLLSGSTASCEKVDLTAVAAERLMAIRV